MTNFNENQRKALDFSRNLIIEAGAGSGKTTVLLARIMTILEKIDHIELKNIVAITFTNKAADELRNRLASALRDKFDNSENQKWKRCFFQLQEAQITTFHSFFKSIITKYSFLLNIDPDFKLISEYLKNKELKEIFRAYSNKKIKEKDREFIQLLLKIGKKSFLNHVIMFSNHSALLELLSKQDHKQLKNDFDNHLDEYFNHIEGIINNDSLFLNLLQKLATNHDANKKINWEFLSSVIDSNRINYKDLIALKNFFLTKSNSIRKNVLKSYTTEMHLSVEDFCNLILKIDLIEFSDYTENDNLYFTVYPIMIEHIHVIISQFRTYKYSEQLYEFDDIEYFFSILVEKYPDTILEIKRMYKFFLIDEFQDTNYKQFEVLKPLMTDSNSSEYFERQSSYFVGDPKQSIYGFRDAEVSVFYSTRDLIIASNEKNKTSNIELLNADSSSKDEKKGVILLNTNYRSESYLLKFFNDLFSVIFGESFNPFEVEYHPLNSHKDSNSTEIDCFINTYEKNDENNISHNRKKEYSYIASKIIELYKSGTKLSEIAILIRSRTNLKVIEDELVKNDIPFISTTENIFNTQEISDLYNWLSYMCFKDDLSLFGILKSKIFNFTEGELFKIFQKKNAFHSLDSKIQDYINTINQDFKNNSTFDFFQKLLIKTNYLGYDSNKAQENLISITNYIIESNEFSENIYDTVNILRIKIESEAKFKDDSETSPNESNKVKIMTIHASKGLQFPVVFIPDLNNQSKSNKDSFFKYKHTAFLAKLYDNSGLVDSFYRQMQKLKDLAEENRILYVAMTRAESKLFLSSTVEIKEEGLKTNKNSVLEKLLEIFPINRSKHSKDNYDFNYVYSIPTNIESLQFNSEQSLIDNESYNLNLSKEKLIFSPTKLATFNKENGEKEYINKYILRMFEQVNLNSSPKKKSTVPSSKKTNDLKNSNDSAILFGELIHEIFENSLLDKNFSYMNYIKQLLLKTKYKPLTIKADGILSYIENIINSNTVEDISKSRFKKSEVSIQLLGHKMLLDGKLDLLYYTDGNYCVVDYKSNKVNNRNECIEIVNNNYLIQSKFYAFLLSKLYPKQRDYTIKFLFTDINEMIENVYGERDILSIKSEISLLIDKIYSFESQIYDDGFTL